MYVKGEKLCGTQKCARAASTSTGEHNTRGGLFDFFVEVVKKYPRTNKYLSLKKKQGKNFMHHN